MIRHVPTGTYRLQLHKEFTFDDAAAIADYLRALGISHVYSSPYLQAAPGSMHGYDVVDPQRVNQELGGAPAHERFCLRLMYQSATCPQRWQSESWDIALVFVRLFHEKTIVRLDAPRAFCVSGFWL